MLTMLIGDEKEYESLDSVCLADEDSNLDDSIYTTEFLNGIRMSYINEDFEGKRTIDTLMDHVPVIDLSDDDSDLPSTQKRNVNNDENVITKDDVRLISSDYEELFPCTERKLSEEDTKKMKTCHQTTYNLIHSKETENDFKVDYDSNDSFINDGSLGEGSSEDGNDSDI
ncbi:hypothetical protein Tco_0511683 [Tanacetum coccineum]